MQTQSYYERHREEVKAKALAYYYANKEKIGVYQKQYTKDNIIRFRESRRDASRRYRERKRELATTVST